MSTDLVVRLRNYGNAVPGTLAAAKPFSMALEAANEIERHRQLLREITTMDGEQARHAAECALRGDFSHE